jgi:hypothetical protein
MYASLSTLFEKSQEPDPELNRTREARLKLDRKVKGLEKEIEMETRASIKVRAVIESLKDAQEYLPPLPVAPKAPPASSSSSSSSSSGSASHHRDDVGGDHQRGYHEDEEARAPRASQVTSLTSQTAHGSAPPAVCT